MMTVKVSTSTETRHFTFSGTRQQLIAMLRKQYPINAKVEIR